jgi:hypothetical protein
MLKKLKVIIYLDHWTKVSKNDQISNSKNKIFKNAV